MTATLPTTTLDRLLALQFTVAWAGEALCEPPRLGWWRTDLVDEEGGGDLLARLLPRTHRWAALEGARRAAFLADWAAYKRMADPDTACAPLSLGYETDDALADRLRDLKARAFWTRRDLQLAAKFDDLHEDPSWPSVRPSPGPPRQGSRPRAPGQRRGGPAVDRRL